MTALHNVMGLAEATAALAGVDAKVRRRLLKAAAGLGGKRVARQAKINAAIRSGLLRKSIGRKQKVYRNTGAAVSIVGPRKGFRLAVGVRTRGKHAGETVYADPTKYAHLVEDGTSKAPAHPFLAPAYRGCRAGVMAEMSDLILSGIASTKAKGA